MGLQQLKLLHGSYMQIYTPPSPLVQRPLQFCSTASITVCSYHSCPPFHAPMFSSFVHPASENQACLPPIALDSQMGPALQLFPLLLPAALAPQKVEPLFPRSRSRSV